MPLKGYLMNLSDKCGNTLETFFTADEKIPVVTQLYPIYTIIYSFVPLGNK
jgi:hypothetical protein